MIWGWYNRSNSGTVAAVPSGLSASHKFRIRRNWECKVGHRLKYTLEESINLDEKCSILLILLLLLLSVVVVAAAAHVELN
jgi:hypothetical protein